VSLKKYYEVISLEWCGSGALNGDWSEARLVKAYDSEDAATTWAEESDQMGDYDIINSGYHGPVLVREEGASSHETYMIEARSEPVYFARKK